jgi:ribosomal protein S18 acetylase RimI-like enzyme
MAEVSGEPAGTVSIGPSDRDGVASITAMWVAPRFRRAGVGRELVVRALAWGRENRYSRVLLWVAEGNDNAERLYERCGFARTGSVDLVRPGEDRVEYEMSVDL